MKLKVLCFFKTKQSTHKPAFVKSNDISIYFTRKPLEMFHLHFLIHYVKKYKTCVFCFRGFYVYFCTLYKKKLFRNTGYIETGYIKLRIPYYIMQQLVKQITLLIMVNSTKLKLKKVMKHHINCTFNSVHKRGSNLAERIVMFCNKSTSDKGK